MVKNTELQNKQPKDAKTKIHFTPLSGEDIPEDDEK